MNSIVYEGKIPATLRMVCDRNRHKVKEVTYSYGWSTDNGYSYEVVLRDGWRTHDDMVHALIDTSAARLIPRIKAAQLCECEDCAQSLPGGMTRSR